MDDFITQHPIQTMIWITILAMVYAAFKTVQDLKKEKLFMGWQDRVLWWSVIEAFVVWGLVAVIVVGSGAGSGGRGLKNPWVGFFYIFLVIPWMGLCVWVFLKQGWAWDRRRKRFGSKVGSSGLTK